jgi:hypothetical protein
MTDSSTVSIALRALLKNRVMFRVAFVGLLVTLAACKESPVGPPVQPPPTVSGVPTGHQPTPGFPSEDQVAGIYDRVTYSSIPGSSRYVLYNDSTFGLQYLLSQFGLVVYGGRYSRADSLIKFDWDGWSSAGPWGAGGTIRGDTLTVKYNDVMIWSDFEDGVYIRTSSGSQ